MTIPEFKIAVVDDQIGRSGHHQAAFLSAVKRPVDEFLFITGQDHGGHNSADSVIDELRSVGDAAGPVRLSLVLLDVRFDDSHDPAGERFGLTLLQILRETFGQSLPIVMLTTEADMRELANESTANGFLPKSELSSQALEAQLFRNALIPDAVTGLVGTSPLFLLTLRELRKHVASNVKEFLLLGETGTGKADLAKYVHLVYPERSGPYRPWPGRRVNPELHYSELFGHWRGAYTGAERNRAGLAELANRGTFFVDEIAELTQDSQSALLEYRNRGRQDGMRRVRRLGLYPGGNARDLDLDDRKYDAAEDRVLVDTVLIAATNQPIADAGERERLGFKHEIFNRLGARITLPPLRHRREDIVPLFTHYLRLAAGRPVQVNPDVVRRLESWEWREGNVAEVRRVAEGVGAQLGPDFETVRLHHLDGLLVEVPQPDLLEGRSHRAVTGASPLDQGPPRFVDFEVAALWGLAERLRTAVLETRRQTGVGSLADILKHATGVEYSSTDVQREIKDILADWFEPNIRRDARWKGHEKYSQWARDVQSDPILSSLYRYGAKQLTWTQAQELIEEALPPLQR